MFKNILLIFTSIAFLSACKKQDNNKALINYKLGGIYVRDSLVTSNGLKKLDLSNEGKYCWTTVVYGDDSSYCQGTYQQITDSTLLWNNDIIISFTITPVDTLPNGTKNPKPKGMFLQINTSPAVFPLFGYYQ